MGRIPPREQKYADIYREKPLRVSQKVLVPIREHPKVISDLDFFSMLSTCHINAYINFLTV